jgi:outer membrane protein assembly factor BamB
MADRKWFYLRLIGAVAVFLFTSVVIFSEGIIATGKAYAAQRYNPHVLSWESLKSPESLKRWQKYRQSDRRLAVSKAGVIKLKKSSFFNTKPFQFSTPTYADSMIFVGVDAGVFYGIRADHLKKMWKYKTEGPVQAASSVEDNVVYFGDIKGHAYALSTSDGGEIWKTTLDAPILVAPLLLHDRVYFATDSGRLIALNKTSGEEIWHTDPIEKSVGFAIKGASSPVSSNGVILFGTSTGILVAYRENGDLAWVKQLAERQGMFTDLDSKPLIVDGRIYVDSADQKVFCLDQNRGSVLWSTSEIGGANNLFLDSNRLYATGAGVLASVDATNGNIIWKQDFETPEVSAPAVNQGIVAVVSTKDKLYLVDDQTGDILFDRYVKGGSFGDPIFIDNHLYLISNTGRLYSFVVREKPPKKTKGS